MGGIDITEFVAHLVIYIVVLLLAISAHEAGHAWMSYKYGDDTAYMLGRVTLNPVKHTDPIGTLLIPIIGFVFGAMGGALGSIPLIGWGKPTPVNPNKWTKYKQANVMVSIAGILANLILMLIAFVIAKIMISAGGFQPRDFIGGSQNPFIILISNMLFLNLSLAIFNLLPFPPLDGSKVLGTFLPAGARPVLDMMEQYGFLILMALLYVGVIRVIITPFYIAVFYLLNL